MSEVRRQAVLIPRPNWGWQDDAACRGKDTVLFFGPDGERQPERDIRERKAKAVCAACPVRALCRAAPPHAPRERGLTGRHVSPQPPHLHRPRQPPPPPRHLLRGARQ
jgi:WhiB family transcriptional regulator, redox-sensing transcriptional regulator